MKALATASALVLAACLAAPNAVSAQPVSGVAKPAPAQRRPNVLVWMLDDVGFAQLGAFGGLVDTPNIDRVARTGLRYSNYHTAPICSASRAALLTGRNPHSVHVGGHVAFARPYPGYDAQLPPSAGSLAENLRQGGYQTFALGKWDHYPIGDASAAGPYDRWPLGQGFDRYYGFLFSETDNWTPLLTRDNTAIRAPDGPGYHLSTDLADQAIAMIDERDARAAPAPFFMYWATGVAHAPHHAPADWIARYRGRFDMGWDKAREVILKRQVAQGLVPAGTKLGLRPEGMPAWDSLSADQKRLYTRQMETFAAALSHADAQFGRILDRLAARGELEDTLVVITSDNGASAEGAAAGMHNEHLFVNGLVASDADNLPFLARWGGPDTFPHYALGWAVAGNTPFRYYKQTAHEGGTRVPLILAWPRGIPARGELRKPFAYVTDLAPTILEAVGVPLAERVNNVAQAPMEGRSLVAGFEDPRAEDRGRAQYVEIFGNKGLWSQDWAIVTTHRTRSWDFALSTPPNEPWELYDLARDPGQTNDLAGRLPARVAAMAGEFEAQAARYQVNPIDNASAGVAELTARGRADFARRGGVWRFDVPTARLSPFAAPPVLNAPYRMTAEVSLASGRESGPVFASGGSTGGVTLYLREGRPVFAMRGLDGGLTKVEAQQVLAPGAHRLELEVAWQPAAAVAPVDVAVTLKVGGEVIARGVPRLPLPRSPGEGFDVGRDEGSTVSADYKPGVAFEGGLRQVVFDFAAAVALARTGGSGR